MTAESHLGKSLCNLSVPVEPASGMATLAIVDALGVLDIFGHKRAKSEQLQVQVPLSNFNLARVLS